VTQHLDLVEA